MTFWFLWRLFQYFIDLSLLFTSSSLNCCEKLCIWFGCQWSDNYHRNFFLFRCSFWYLWVSFRFKQCKFSFFCLLFPRFLGQRITAIEHVIIWLCKKMSTKLIFLFVKLISKFLNLFSHFNEQIVVYFSNFLSLIFTLQILEVIFDLKLFPKYLTDWLVRAVKLTQRLPNTFMLNCWYELTKYSLKQLFLIVQKVKSKTVVFNYLLWFSILVFNVLALFSKL